MPQSVPKLPFTCTPSVSGTSTWYFPVSSTLASSVLLTPIPKAPTAPNTELCLEPVTTIWPGFTSSLRRYCSPVPFA